MKPSGHSDEDIAGVLRSDLEALLQSQHDQVIMRLTRVEQAIVGLSAGVDSCRPSVPQGCPPPLYAAQCDVDMDTDARDDSEDHEDAMEFFIPRKSSRRSSVEDRANLVFSAKLSYVENATYTEKADSVAASLSRLSRSVSNLYVGDESQHHLRDQLKLLTSSKWFDWLAVLMILSNAVFLGFHAEHYPGMSVVECPPVVQAFSWFYSVMFFFELILRIIADGRAFFYNKMWIWNVFDFFTVASSAVEMVLQIFDVGQGSRNLSLLRLLRVVRIIRILRVIRISRFFRELRVLVLAISSALRSLIWAMLLLLTIMYVTGIALTQSVLAYAETTAASFATLQTRYGSISRSIYTLWLTISGGISWVEVADPLVDVDPMYLALLVCFIAFVQVAVLNVVTGVFCENAIKSAANDEEEVLQEQVRHKQLYIERLTKLFHDCESGSSGKITLRDFESKLSDPIAIAYFRMMDLEVPNALALFRLLDGDDSGLVELDEFVEGCLALRGTAKRIDVAKILKKSTSTLEHVLSVKRDTMLLTELVKQITDLRPAPNHSLWVQSVALAAASSDLAPKKITAECRERKGGLLKTFSL